MRENEFVVGSALSTGDEIFVKDSPGHWVGFIVDRELSAEEIEETLDVCSEFIEVLVKPSGVEVLDDLPSGSIVEGKTWVASKVRGDWSIGGFEGWFGSESVAEILGDFEVVCKGVEA